MRLGLVDFLGSSQELPFWNEDWKVLIFTGSIYSGSFLSKWRNLVKHSVGIDLPYVQLNNNELPLALSQCTFWDSEKCYWIGDVGSRAVKTFDYCGPHRLIMFASKCSLEKLAADHTRVVELPERIEAVVAAKLIAAMGSKVSNVGMSFIERMARSLGGMSLDQLVWLLNYLDLAGFRSEDNLDSYCCEIFERDLKLFELTDYLFANDKKKFFMLWDRVNFKYSPAFWLSFFARTMWGGGCFVQLMHMNKQLEAKKVGRGLPWEFLRVGWKKYRMSFFSEAYAGLYRLDCMFKTQTVSVSQFDNFFFSLFYSKSTKV